MKRLSVNTLLKSIIAVLVAAVISALAISAWSSWTRLASVTRIAEVADISSQLFTALHNLRVDRSNTNRDLLNEQARTSINPQVARVRAAEMPALQAGLKGLQALALPVGMPPLVASLEQAVKKLELLQQESTAAFLQPKAQRRPALAKEFFDEAEKLMDILDKLSSGLTRWVKLEDPFVDQLLNLKQLGWLARNAAGDVAVHISNGIGGQPLGADALIKDALHTGQLQSAWAGLQDLAAGLPLPPRFAEAMEVARKGYLAPEYRQMQVNTLKSLMAGNPAPMSVDQWSPLSVAKLATLLGVAETALHVAKDYATEQRTLATRNLAFQLGLLAFAVVGAVGMMFVVTRRVTAPLTTLQKAMHKLASGDLTAEVSYADRKDEIGALGSAMQVFKTSMMEAESLRAAQKETEIRTMARRKQEMQKLADEFQAAVGGIVGAVSTASGELEAAAGTLTQTAENTQRLSGVVAAASEEASANVQAVSAAAEEMSSSVNEIGRQVQESSRIAGEAVAQAGRTDARINELSNAASRIGDVVKLITAIAEQTNLLALNATIEAARAGDAGRGFAVVAQEVKALAAQTAKATDEIGTQISNMQSATQDSVAAIKEISGTIGRIAEIAGAIAAAVEEQGAATQEISRNVAQAAHGTSQVAANITDVNRGANETGSASSQVLGSAQSLARESGQLKREVEKFVSTVRAA